MSLYLIRKLQADYTFYSENIERLEKIKKKQQICPDDYLILNIYYENIKDINSLLSSMIAF